MTEVGEEKASHRIALRNLIQAARLDREECDGVPQGMSCNHFWAPESRRLA